MIRYENYNPENTNNCIIRSFSKITGKEPKLIEEQLIRLAATMKHSDYTNVKVFEKYLELLQFEKIDNKNEDIQIKNLNLEDGTYSIFCWDKKDFYHMVTISDNVLFDKKEETLNLYPITIYKSKHQKNNKNITYDLIFESNNIYFVKLNEELIDEYLKMVNDPEVQKYISHNRKKYVPEEEINWVKSKILDDSIIFSMIEKKTNEFIGNIEIMNIENNIGELGIAITPEKQDKHYGQEAIKTLIDYAINILKLDGLELNVFNFNPRGIHCYEKVGFVNDGKGKTEEDIHMIYHK